MILHVIQSHVELEMSVSFDFCYNITTHLIRPFPFHSVFRVSYWFSFMSVTPLYSVELQSRLSV